MKRMSSSCLKYSYFPTLYIVILTPSRFMLVLHLLWIPTLVGELCSLYGDCIAAGELTEPEPELDCMTETSGNLSTGDRENNQDWTRLRWMRGEGGKYNNLSLVITDNLVTPQHQLETSTWLFLHTFLIRRGWG